jgi:hypothetical protein
LEARFHNWAAWKRKEPLADETDAQAVDKVIKTLRAEDREILTAVYVQHPYQSIYYVSAEVAVPPTFINRAIERAKNAIGST